MSEPDPHDPAGHVRVVVWTRDLSQPPDDPRRSVLARLRDLDAAGLVDEVIRLPLVSLAVYEDDRLVGVFPCSTGEGTETVGDCLRRLETGEFVGESTTD